MNLIY